MSNGKEYRNPVDFTKLTRDEFLENETRFQMLRNEVLALELENSSLRKENAELSKDRVWLGKISMPERSEAKEFDFMSMVVELANCDTPLEMECLRRDIERDFVAKQESASMKAKDSYALEALEKFLGRPVFDNDFSQCVLAKHPNPDSKFRTFESLYYKDVILGVFIQDGANLSFQPTER